MSREIDSLVAKKVMGWGTATVRRRTGHGPGGNWSPSTDPAAAWEVVERMRTQCAVQIDTVGFEPNVFRCVMGWGDDKISGNAEATTMPLAVCCAALACFGVEVKP